MMSLTVNIGIRTVSHPFKTSDLNKAFYAIT